MTTSTFEHKEDQDIGIGMDISIGMDIERGDVD
jgi:hypothetical protein